MCDSDDTDFLLLIPPDYFAVNSVTDSEDCDCTSSLEQNNEELDCSIVDNLISHVKTLENRVTAIENVENCANSSEVCNCQCPISNRDGIDCQESLMTTSQAELAGTIDSAYNSLSSRKTLSCTQPSSTVDINVFNKHFSNSIINENDVLKAHNTFRPDVPTESSDRSESLSSCRNTFMSEYISQSDNQLDEHKLITEIDKYFNTYLNNSPGITENMDQSVVPLNSANNSNKIAEQNQVMQLRDLKSSIEHSETKKHYELTEVEKLLNEMEKTQYEIEEKLKTRESKLQKPFSEKYNTSSSAFQCGDTVSSVPNLGFGLRDMCYSNPSREKNDLHPLDNVRHGDAVIEEPCVKTRINTVGSSSLNFNGKPFYSNNVADLKFHSYPKINSDPLTKAGADSITSSFRQKLNITSLDAVEDKGSAENDLVKNTSSWKGDELLKSDKNKKDPSIINSIGHFEDFSSNEEKANESVVDSLKKKRIPPRRLGNRFMRATNLSNPKVASSSGFDIKNNTKSRSRMMSLSDLWNDSACSANDGSPSQLLQKLEEEQCKRQHCEQQIHELQRKVLEQQEKLAVAVRVDKEKDKAIGQMHAGWQRLANHWNELEEQRNALSLQLETQNKSINAKTEEINQRKGRWEKEMSQALDLAAGYKNKCESIAFERDQLVSEMRSKIEEALAKLTEAEKEQIKCKEENRILLDKLAENEIDSEKITLCERLERCLNFLRNVDKQLISEYEMKLKEVESKLIQMEGEVSVLREQKEHANAKWKDEKARFTVLEQQKDSLQSALEELRKTEKSMKEELKNSTQKLETEKVELRSIFQSQLEAVVREKVKEFQTQLDEGVASLNSQHRAREKELAEKAAQECSRLVERHRLEIQNLEQKHRADFKMMHNKILDIEKEKIEMKMKLDKETKRRAEMAQKLHGVMEANWKQALQIIVSSPATATSGNLKNKGDEDRKKKHWTNRDERKLVEDQEHFKLELSKLMSTANGDDGSPSPEAPFNLDTGQLTYRLHPNKESTNENPPPIQHSSHQNQLKRYIQMLLERAPGHPVEDQSYSAHDSSVNSSSFADSQSSWAKFMSISSENKPTSESSRPEQLKKNHGSKSKHPWK